MTNITYHNYNFDLLENTKFKSAYVYNYDNLYVYYDDYIRCNIITQNVSLNHNLQTTDDCVYLSINGDHIMVSSEGNEINFITVLYTNTFSNITRKFKEFLRHTQIDMTQPEHIVNTQIALRVNVIDILQNYYMTINRIKPIQRQTMHTYRRFTKDNEDTMINIKILKLKNEIPNTPISDKINDMDIDNQPSSKYVKYSIDDTTDNEMSNQ